MTSKAKILLSSELPSPLSSEGSVLTLPGSRMLYLARGRCLALLRPDMVLWRARTCYQCENFRKIQISICKVARKFEIALNTSCSCVRPVAAITWHWGAHRDIGVICEDAPCAHTIRFPDAMTDDVLTTHFTIQFWRKKKSTIEKEMSFLSYSFW